jgi:two-component system, chemotaxis family, sensor kinase CheA
MIRNHLTRIDGLAAFVAALQPVDAPALASRRSDLAALAKWARDKKDNVLENAVENALRSLDQNAAEGAATGESLAALSGMVVELRELLGALLELEARQSKSLFPGAFDNEILNEFVTEGSEQLAESEAHLLDLEADPENTEAINAVFRCFHTIKGLAGFLNLADIESLAHASEDLLDLVREGKARLQGATADVVLDAIDLLKRLVAEVPNLTSPLAARGNERVQSTVAAIREHTKELTQGLGDAVAELDLSESAAPEQHLDVAEPTTDRVEAASAVATAPTTEPEDGTEPGMAAPPATPADVEINDAERDAAFAAAMDAVPQTETSAQKPAARKRVEPRGEQSAVVDKNANDTIRVAADRLDRLVDMIGELVITQSMVCRATEKHAAGNRHLDRDLGRMEKITREIQELAGSLRTVELRSLFRKMTRLARDVAKKTERQVEFRVVGEDAELDKAIVDRIGDPLVHLVRNAIDHGIEKSPAERVAKGKPAAGRVELRAFHRGGSVFIEIEDDGKGIDREAVLTKARERGLVVGGDALTDREVYRLLCEPGFSMAKEVTQLSGRGVGMDVVKRHIEQMGGTLDIRSEIGKGSIFSLQLPLTLAVIDGMVILVGSERYIIPTLSVVRLVKLQPGDITPVVGAADVLRVQDELIPVVRVGELFRMHSGETYRPMALIAEGDGTRVALLIDEVLGQQQAVIKGLGESIGDTPGISGCAIMSDGRVGLVMDISGMQRLATTRAGASAANFSANDSDSNASPGGKRWTA